ncbi:MAG TPA: 50S ribosomal protein L35ae [Candidatus Aenigmarchaeota archaeon]|nr:50S ribosomal protein L35ae [Candidatus Aenigmarchaeota archaeon]
MNGIIVSFRRGRHTQNTRHVLIKVDGIDSREKATELIGKEVVWTSPSGKEIKGKVASPHGKKGVIRVIFEKGLPGQALGTEVKIVPQS